MLSQLLRTASSRNNSLLPAWASNSARKHVTPGDSRRRRRRTPPETAAWEVPTSSPGAAWQQSIHVSTSPFQPTSLRIASSSRTPFYQPFLQRSKHLLYRQPMLWSSEIPSPNALAGVCPLRLPAVSPTPLPSRIRVGRLCSEIMIGGRPAAAASVGLDAGASRLSRWADPNPWAVAPNMFPASVNLYYDHAPLYLRQFANPPSRAVSFPNHETDSRAGRTYNRSHRTRPGWTRKYFTEVIRKQKDITRPETPPPSLISFGTSSCLSDKTTTNKEI